MKATDHKEELQGKLRQSKKIAENLNMTESQVVDGGLSGVDVQEQEKMLAEVKAQHDAQKQNKSQAEEEGFVAGTGKQKTVFNVSDVTPSMVDEQQAEWDRLQKENNEKEAAAERKPYSEAVRKQMLHTTTPVIHGPSAGAGLQHNCSTLPEAQNNVQAEATCNPCPPGHVEHIHVGYQHQSGIAAEKQQLVDQVPDWLKTDNMVGVKIPGFHEPMTGMVKFVGVVQVKGVDKLIAGVQLVSVNFFKYYFCH